MRYHQIVTESPAMDVAASTQSHQAFQALIKYVRSRPYADYHIDLNDDWYFCFDPANFAIEGLFGDPDLIIMIGEIDRSGTVDPVRGAYTHFSEKKLFDRFRRAIIVRIAQSEDYENVKKCLNTIKFMKVFEHEFIHCLDDTRTGGMVMASEPSSKFSQSDYYNNAWEFNAFYHELANSLTGILREINDERNHETSATDIVDLYGFDPNFKSFVQSMGQSDKGTRRFIEELTTPRRRALLKRLYLLHTAVVDAARQDEMKAP